MLPGDEWKWSAEPKKPPSSWREILTEINHDYAFDLIDRETWSKLYDAHIKLDCEKSP